MIQVGPGPSINTLVVIACEIHALGVAIQNLHELPLQGSQVLRFINKTALEKGEPLRFGGYVNQHIGKVEDLILSLVTCIL